MLISANINNYELWERLFRNQGGHQTGNWGAAGAQQARGHWKAVGNWRQGQLVMVDQSDRKSAITYQVHIKQGEVCWGAYFSNGRLYSVKYIHRQQMQGG